jgi:hypothetical protein
MPRSLLLATLTAIALATLCSGQQTGLGISPTVIAGAEISIPAPGTGEATFYLASAAHVAKRKLSLGQPIRLSGQDLSIAGRYVAILCAGSCRSQAFFVTPAAPASLSFVVHPSRAWIGREGAISGVALPFDKFHNLVQDPVNVDFSIVAGGSKLYSASAPSRRGIAWFRAASGSKAGAAQLTASAGTVSARRALQLVASDPCRLQIRATPAPKGVAVETEPIHDCSGNAIPDGTIVTFTANGADGISTVDAPVKHGVARALLASSGNVVITAASGVVMGNELRMSVKP